MKKTIDVLVKFISENNVNVKDTFEFLYKHLSKENKLQECLLKQAVFETLQLEHDGMTISIRRNTLWGSYSILYRANVEESKYFISIKEPKLLAEFVTNRWESERLEHYYV